MDGDLTGTFPNPSLDPSLLAGLATDVELLERLERGHLRAASPRTSRTPSPGTRKRFRVPAAGGGTRTGQPAGCGDRSCIVFKHVNEGLKNVQGRERGPGGHGDPARPTQAPYDSITSDELGAGDDVDLVFPPDTNTQSARYLQLTVYWLS